MNKVKLIKSVVSEFYDVSVDDLESKSKIIASASGVWKNLKELKY